MSTEDILGLAEGTSPLHQIHAQVCRVADARNGLIVMGEPGSGREIVARAVHARHSTPVAPFVAVYCGNSGRDDLEQQLFGRPSPNDRSKAPAQACERVYPGSAVYEAMGGTLYIRNIEELPTKVQSRLARLLRDRECRLGSRDQSVTYSVRPIAAIDPDVDGMIADGRLRTDLFRRFSSNQINVSPLRECRAEIPALADFLLANACRRIGIPAKSIESAASALLAAMPWRGNARELMGVVHMLTLKVLGDVVTLDALLETVKLESGGPRPWNIGVTLREARQHFEREYIAAVVAQFHGRVPDAARSLGIQRTNLYRKLRSLHIRTFPEKAPGASRTARA